MAEDVQLPWRWGHLPILSFDYGCLGTILQSRGGTDEGRDVVLLVSFGRDGVEDLLALELIEEVEGQEGTFGLLWAEG